MRGKKDRFACVSVFLRYVFCVFKRGLHKGLSLVLSFCLAFHPLLAQAQMVGSASSPSPAIQGIKAAEGENFSTRPTIGQAGNGVVLIDIARPNNQGLSHNKYDSFNVGVHGVILNNSTENISRSQLGGLVFGNGNLRDTGAAKVILNEVVSTNHSRLEGVSEVHGQSADVIIANPNGITCNGCGFINTPRVTLSTGQPLIGVDGTLSGFRVEGGALTIGTQGADGRVLDIFDLVSRKISVAGPIQVKGDLAIIAGRNHFDYHKREATSLGTDGKEPELAIDSSDLGGMYAGQIRIIANDKGAGVKMHGSMVSNAGAMQLSSDGKLVIAKARAKGSVKAQSHHASVHVENLLFSESSVELKALDAVELVDHARVAASGAVDVNSAVIKLEHDALVASGIGNDGQQSATGSLHLKAAKLDAGSGRIASGDLLWIQAETIDLSRAEDNNQTGVSSLGNLTFETNTITAFNNHIGARGTVIVKAEDSLTIGAGHYSAGGSFLAEAAEISSYASLTAGQEIDLYAHSGHLIQEGALLSNGVVTLQARGALNNKGDIVSVQKVSLTAGGALTVGADSRLLGHDVTLRANVLTQAGDVEAQGGALTLQVDDKITNLGTIRGDTVNARAGSLLNQGMLIATGDLHLQVSAQQAAFSQQAAVVNASEAILQSGGAFVLSAGQLQNIGLLGSRGADVALDVVGDVSNSGLIYAKKSTTLSLDGTLRNKYGKVIAEESLSIGGLKGERAGSVINEAGVFSAFTGEMNLVATSFVNKSGEATNFLQQDATLNGQRSSNESDETAYLLARGGLLIDVGAFQNIDGLISTQGSVTVFADSVKQTGRIEIESGDLQLISYGDLTNSGTLESNGAIALNAHNDLHQTGRIVAKKRVELSASGSLMMGETSKVAAYDVALEAGTFTQAGDVEAQGGTLTLKSYGVLINYGTMVGGIVDATLGSLANSGQLLSNGAFTLVAANHNPSLGQDAQVLNTDSGVLQSGGAFVLTMDALNNAGMLGSSGGDVALNLMGDVHNSGLIYAKKSAAISLDGSFINKFGDVIAEDNFSIRGFSGDRAGHVINNSGVLEAVSGDMAFDVSTLSNMREGGVEITNKVVGYHYDPGEFVSHGIKHYTDKTTTATTITREESHLINSAGQILAGGHLSINAGDVSNSYSLIAANGNIVVRADAFLNQGRDLIETTKIVRKTYHRYKHCTVWNGGCLADTTDEWADPARTEIISHTYDAVYGTIEAGGFLDAKVTGYLDNHAVREGADQVGLSSGDKGLFGVENADFDGIKPLISAERLDGMIDGLVGHTALFLPSAQTQALQSVWNPTQDELPPVTTELVSAQSPNAPFLIETRPGFIDPGKFFGSDYFLDRLDFKLGQEFKRLGDAHFEYRLVNEQIFELTGNRSLVEVDDPNAQMQRLYDNAVEQQALLGLELGDPLSPKQIVGLKKDIIWLETHTVGGQKVLVPRVYLAPNASKVQGTHQENFAGARLKGNGLALTAENFVNSGAVVSDGALHVTTTKTSFNDGGFVVGTGGVKFASDALFINSSGIVQGATVAITAATVMNSTAKINDFNEYGFIDRSGQQAQIIAANDLSIQSLGDLSAYGGQFTSGGSMALTVDGSATFGALVLESTQAQRLEDSSLNAQSHHNQLSGLNSGGDLTIQTGSALSLEGAKLKAEGDGQLTAGGDISVASVQDVRSSDWEVQRTKKGGLSSKKIHAHQHSEEVTTVKTTVEAGGKLSVHAQGGDLTVVGAGLKSGGETHLKADQGQIKLLTTKDQDFKQNFQHDENLFWWSERDQGHVEESINHVTMEAGGGVKIDAGNGIVVEYEKTGSFEKSLDELARLPELSWIKQLRDDPILAEQVSWQAVEAQFEDWDYKSQGLTEAGAALVTLVVTALSSGTASTAASAITGALGVGSNAAMSAAINAGVQSLINKGAVSLINNGGNIGAALQELGSSKAVLSVVTSMVTVGLTSQATAMAGVGHSLPKTAPVIERVAHEAEKNIIKAVISTGVQTALEGGSLDENLLANLRTALSGVVGKTLAEEIGTAKAEGKIDTVTQIVAHAGLGCLVGATASGDCSAGAIGGAVGEAAAMLQYGSWIKGLLQEEVGDLDGRTLTAEEQAGLNAKIDAQFADFKVQTIDVARVAGGFAAALAGGDVNTGADAAGNAAENNYLSSAQQAQMQRELAECLDDQCRRDINEKWHEIDNEQDNLFATGMMVGVIASSIMSAIELPRVVYDTLSHPIETSEGIISWATSGNVWNSIVGDIEQSVTNTIENFEKAGVDGAFNAGFGTGNLTADVGSIAFAGAGLVTGGVKLTGKVVKQGLKVAAKTEAAVIKTGSEVAQSLEKNSSKVNEAGKKVKDPQEKNEGTAKKNKDHHDEKRKEKIQELEAAGCIACKKEPTFKTQHESGKRTDADGVSWVSSRPDIIYMDQDVNINLIEIKTGEGKLSDNQKILGEAYKTNTAIPTGENFWEFMNENKHVFPDYQKKFIKLKNGFTGTAKEFDEQLKALDTKWLNEQKKQFKDGLKIHSYEIIRYPGRLEVKE
ncbi:two-partner secretion domain-containing protein [Bartonella sp. B17]